MRLLHVRRLLWVLAVLAGGISAALAQAEKKADDDKSTVEEKTLGLLPQPLQNFGVKFAAT